MLDRDQLAVGLGQFRLNAIGLHPGEPRALGVETGGRLAVAVGLVRFRDGAVDQPLENLGRVVVVVPAAHVGFLVGHSFIAVSTDRRDG